MAQSDFSQLEKQIQLHLQKSAEKAFIVVEKKALDLLQQHIDDDVYNFDPEPNKFYKPTYEFKNAFVWGDMDSSIKEIKAKLFYNYNSMRPPTLNDSNNGYTHGNARIGDDRRKDLAYWLNADGAESENTFRQKKRNAYWDNFEKELDEKIYGWFDKEFAKYGITGYKITK